MKINIAGGTGIMGKVHKSIFENAGHEVIISGRSTSPGLVEAAKGSDLTIVSVPIPATSEVIQTVAPYAKGLMDFTGLKQFPINEMLEYSSPRCEVGGLHPLYGNVSSLEGKVVVYCSTERSGEKCLGVIKALEFAGAKIKTMSPEKHDLIVGGIAQNARILLLEAFGSLMEGYGISARDLYDVSPPPTRILLDLIARQVDSNNDELYKAMKDYNPFTAEIEVILSDHLNYCEDEGKISQKIRKCYGNKFLAECQARAKELIEKRLKIN